MTRKVYQADFGSQADQMVLSAAVNPIHNGGFTVWQRGASFASPVNGTYGPDRWSYTTTGTTAVHDMTRSTDVPAVAALAPLTSYSVLLDCTTADAAVGAADLVCFRQAIEGRDFQPFAQQPFALGFWVKATKTGTYGVSLKNSGADRSYIAEYTVNVTDTWEYKAVAVTAGPSAGTWDYTTGVGLYVDFTLMAGATHQTTGGAWQTGHYYGTASQVNACDSTANDFRLWGVTIGLGTTVAPFWPRSFGEELALCRRYYQKSEPYATAPGAGAGVFLQPVATSADTGPRIRMGYPLPVEMRSAPTARYWDGVGNLSKISTIATDTVTNNVAAGVVPVSATTATLHLISADGPILLQYDLSADL